jgi:hypothetical protein
MNTAALRRRIEILDEFALLAPALGVDLVHQGDGRPWLDRQAAGDSVVSRRADSVWTRSMFMPPWRPRLKSGELGPEYGPVTPSHWHNAWTAWRESRAAGALWDEETAWSSRPRPAPAEQPTASVFLGMEAFLERFGHELTAAELKVASLRWRDRLRPPTIAKRLGMNRPDVAALLRSVIARWTAVCLGRTAA